jgi:hypothetical protein
MATSIRRFLSRWARKPAPQKSRTQLRLLSLEERAVPTYTVTNTNDSGAGSLRDAITSANSSPATIDATGVTGTISLKSALPAISASYAIDGPTSGTLKVDGGAGGFGVFYIYNGSSLISVTFDHLTISDGSVSGGGGGVYDNGENLTMTHCTVDSNTATSGNGGGVFITNAPSVTITSCTMTNNSAGSGSGGALYMNDPGDADGTASISLSTFGTSGNGNTALSGGGIYIDSMDDTVTIDSSTVAYNSATSTSDGGGGIVINDANYVTVKSSTINNNNATKFGGGIYYPDSVVNDTTYNVQDSTIAGNSASHGGGIFVNGQSLGTTDMRVYNSTIALNSASDIGTVYDGGGIGFTNFKKSGDSILIESTIVASNTASNTNTDAGPDIGGIGGYGPITAIHCLIGVADDGGWTLSGGSANNYDGTLATPESPGFATGSLANNGGPTQTIAITKASDAHDHGDNVLGLSADQTGGSRVRNGAADIGAYEYPDNDI